MGTTTPKQMSKAEMEGRKRKNKRVVEEMESVRSNDTLPTIINFGQNLLPGTLNQTWVWIWTRLWQKRKMHNQTSSFLCDRASISSNAR